MTDGGGLAHRLMRWSAVRCGATAQRGVLLYVDGQGQVHELGAYTPHQLSELHWAVSVAYNLGTRRDVRSRLAAIRPVSSKLAELAHLLPTPSKLKAQGQEL